MNLVHVFLFIPMPTSLTKQSIPQFDDNNITPVVAHLNKSKQNQMWVIWSKWESNVAYDEYYHNSIIKNWTPNFYVHRVNMPQNCLLD